MYIHRSIDYTINIRGKTANNTQTYTMTYKKSMNTYKYTNYIQLIIIIIISLFTHCNTVNGMTMVHI